MNDSTHVDDYQALRERIKTALWDAGHLRSWSYNSEVLADAVLGVIGVADVMRACGWTDREIEAAMDAAGAVR